MFNNKKGSEGRHGSHSKPDFEPMNDMDYQSYDAEPQEQYAAMAPADMGYGAPMSPATTGEFVGKPGSHKRKKAMKQADKTSVNTYSRGNGTYNKKDRKKPGKARKTILAILIVLLLGVVGAGVALGWYVSQLDKEIQVANEEEAAAINDALAPVMSGEPFYMVLLGTDQRKGQTVGRSDTCILTRVDPENATISMISIPRDTAIRYKGSTMKFNAAYVYDGPSGSITAASQLCGVKISHYAQVNFKGLADVVDAIGGVTVDVPVAINDSHAGYVSVKAGKQHLNGKKALVFARSRAYGLGDFQRSTSQRMLVEAAIKQVLNMNPTKVPNAITKAAKSVTTDFTIMDLIGLAGLFQGAEKVKIYSALMPSSTAMVDGVSYVVCNTGQLAEMMKLMNAGKDPAKAANDGTVKSSKEAKKKGMTTIVK